MTFRKIFATLTALAACSLGQAQVSVPNYGNGLPATDKLGRSLPGTAETGTPKKDKFVGIFYWTWHNNFADVDEVHDVSKIISKYPEAAGDYNHPAWFKDNGYYFWSEPLWGYYLDTDEWVLRKQAEMLADAGVDVVVFDCTNGSMTWEPQYMALCKAFTKARKDGVRTPQIAFMLGFAPSMNARKAIMSIYDALYSKGLYQDLWFYWKGKPLIMAYPEMLGEVPGDAALTAKLSKIRDFFTFRPGQPVYDKGPQRPDHWGWLEIYPQHGFAPGKNGVPEQVTVGVAQNWSKANHLSAMNSPGTFGRSYTHNPVDKQRDSVNYGYNFAEQWGRALELNPEFVFITGWNEWVAGRAKSWYNFENAFPDQFSEEKSRDIEPMKGGHEDSYYYQMVNYIRKFKGSPEVQSSATRRNVKVDGRFDEWTGIASYATYKGSTIHRDSPGFAKLHYVNTTGRNDFTGVRVAYTKKYVNFLIETADAITPSTDKAWMRLLIDADCDKSTGWEGYDFMLNYASPDKDKAVVSRNVGDAWNWKEAGKVKYAVKGNKMEVQIPRKLLRLTGNARFEFKLSDNMQEEGKVMDFYLNGDVAPLGRFNYPCSLGAK